MAYIDGAVCSVPTSKKTEYLTFAKTAAALFRKHGALQVVEGWGDDIPEGKLTSFLSAVDCWPDDFRRF